MPASDPPFPDSRNVIEPGCQRCPALAEHRTCISWGTGSLDANVVVVGEAPGSGNPDAEDWQGGNWTGKAYTSRHSGRRVRRMVERIGYGDAYYTNAVKCFPASEEPRTSTASGEATNAETLSTEDLPSNREPTPAERAHCRTHLVTEIETLEPAVLLATGKHATKSVLATEDRELDGFIETVLEPVRCEQLETWLVPILHPSYQDVWIGRLGYEPEEYLAAIRETVDECGRPSQTRASE
ncbi:uracil-DNA glycosylase [Natrialba chahannaoensis JCM 10990]|uniref:Uracil-DNA glycosylase n=1 Tax=Natrialba chahannaoensis JCM 10990 TaxID=1227492 RepID=M0AXH3_9EURY|nr:uracil-DNA glycosylase [Natrialba chahannaoensis]ELZ02997.1 uracil-DNA glycosylase [Natrialba chahannaoensis JCM 10990]